MIHFLNITIQCKAADDWRSFLDWADSSNMLRYQLRGYGETPGTAADSAWNRFNEDRNLFSDIEGDWK